MRYYLLTYIRNIGKVFFEFLYKYINAKCYHGKQKLNISYRKCISPKRLLFIMIIVYVVYCTFTNYWLPIKCKSFTALRNGNFFFAVLENVLTIKIKIICLTRNDNVLFSYDLSIPFWLTTILWIYYHVTIRIHEYGGY